MRNPKSSETPAELSIYVPRAVRLSGAGRLVAVIAIAMAVAGVVVPILLWADRERKAELRGRIEREGVATDAVVTRTGKTGGDHPRRYAEYRYAGGQGRAMLDRDERPAPGDRIRVRYLRDEPWRSWSLGDEPYGAPLGVIPALAASFQLGASLMALGLRRQWRLLAEGRSTIGTIVEVKRTKDSHGHRSYRAQYEIALLSGAVRRIWADAGKESAVGSLAPVVYDPENPKRLSRYPLSLVRVAR